MNYFFEEEHNTQFIRVADLRGRRRQHASAHVLTMISEMFATRQIPLKGLSPLGHQPGKA